MKTSKILKGWKLIICDQSGNFATYEAASREALEKIVIDLKLPDNVTVKIKNPHSRAGND